jgi:4-amino-4-deoxy-L-arabinose transferase-like glycosyltransferase
MDVLIDKPTSHRLTLAGITINDRWLRLAVPLGLFLAALLPRLLGLTTFLTADEDDQIMFASLFLKSVLQGDLAGALVLGYPGVPTLILGAVGVAVRYWLHYQGWLPLPWVTADLMTTLGQVTTRFGVFAYPLDFLLWVRIPIALAASLSIVGIYLLARRLLDERLALLGALLIAFDPFILAHSRVIHVDAPLAYFMFLSFLAFLLFIDRGGWPWLLLSGLFGGLAALSKTPAVLLGPILIVSGLSYALSSPPGQPRTRRWQRLALALIGWGLIAALAFTALWPAMWTRPAFALEWITRNVQSVNSIAHPTTGHFWGNQISDQSPTYYLLALPFHLTPLVTLGLVAAMGLIIAGLIARWRNPTAWSAQMLPLALSLLAYGVIFTTAVSLISRRGDRYILPIFFAADLLAVLGLWWLLGVLHLTLKRLTLERSAFQLATPRLLALAIALQAFAVLLYHPYYLAYYNPLLGGGRAAAYRLNVGWGEGLDLAARYLNAQTGQNPPQVAAWYSSQFAPYYHGQTVDLSDQTSALTGDYTVFYLNQVQRGFPSREILAYFEQREPEHVVNLGGAPYAWIFAGPVVSQEPPSKYAFPTEALLGGGARLIGVDVPRLTMPADAYAEGASPGAAGHYFGDPMAGLPVTLYWETAGRIRGEHNIYIRLVDEQGHTWGQVDRLILAGMWRPDRWHTGYYLRDEYRLPIDPATPPGLYHLEVGMYDFVTGQSYGVVKNIGQLTLTPPAKLPRLEDLKLDDRLPIAINQTLTQVGHDYIDQEATPGGEITGKIFWQAAKSIPTDYHLEFFFESAAERKKYVVAQTALSTVYPPTRWRPNEIVGAAYRFRLPAETPPGAYPLQVNVLDPDTGQPAGPPIPLAAITIKTKPRNFNLPPGVIPVSAYLNDEIELVGYKLHNLTTPPAGNFDLTLYWRSLRPAESNYTTFVHAVGPDQVIRGQWDSAPAQGAAPTGGWLPGQIVEDHYRIPMAKDAPPWKYDIFVGMYDPLTGQRLPAASQSAPISENRVWLTRLQVEEKR